MGSVIANPEAGFISRSVAAKIYNVDGTAQVYFTQASNGDPDEKGTDNTIILTGNYITGTTSTSTDMQELANDILAILEKGYTTVYLEGSYYNKLISIDGTNNYGSKAPASSSFYSIFNLIEDLIESSDTFGSGYTYSIDFSDTSKLDSSNTSTWVFRYIQPYIYQDLTYLKSITFPSTIRKISDSAFVGCTNLKYVTIGSATDPLTSFEGIDSSAFYDMADGCIFTIYTTVNIPTLNQYYVSRLDIWEVGTVGGTYMYVFYIAPTATSSLTPEKTNDYR